MKHHDDTPRIPGPAADDPMGDEFAALASELAGLRADLEPDTDLWHGIEARLEPRRRRQSERFLRPRAVAYPGVWRQALAAGLGLVVGAVLTWLAMGGASGSSTDPSEGAATQVRLASTSATAADAETQFLRAKEELWLVVFARRDQLSPEAWRMVEQNLRILDSAVEDLHAALGDDPGNPDLERRILRHQRRSLDLLRDVAGGLSDSV